MECWVKTASEVIITSLGSGGVMRVEFNVNEFLLFSEFLVNEFLLFIKFIVIEFMLFIKYLVNEFFLFIVNDFLFFYGIHF